MDNLTHTLIGVIAGESIAQSTHGTRPGLAPDVRRTLFVALAAIGGNLPDLDLVYSLPGISHDKLSYVLQHRGYTHSVLGCVVLALLLYAGTELWVKLKRLTLTRRDRLELGAMALFGTLLHLGMDALNSYGVHPFWPAGNHWFYGDSVFIVEPLYWAAAAPLFFVLRSIVMRVVLALALLAAILLSALSSVALPVWSVGFALLTLTLLLVGARTSPRTAALTSAGLLVSITAMFILAGHLAARRIDSIVAADFPSEQLVDHVLTPMPMNPFCWDVLVLTTNGDRYAIRHAVLADAAGLIAARRCPMVLQGQGTTAPLAKVAAPESPQIHWLGEFAMSRSQLATLVAQHCDAAALMRFARAPFATVFERHWVVGDFRFDRERQLGMAEIELGAPSAGQCPATVPWVAPRADLLQLPPSMRAFTSTTSTATRP